MGRALRRRALGVPRDGLSIWTDQDETIAWDPRAGADIRGGAVAGRGPGPSRSRLVAGEPTTDDRAPRHHGGTTGAAREPTRRLTSLGAVERMRCRADD